MESVLKQVSGAISKQPRRFSCNYIASSSSNFSHQCLFSQRVLGNPDTINSIDEDFRNLQDAKSKLHLPQEEEQLETAVRELRTRWDEVKNKIDELHPKMQIMAENFSDYKDKLQSLAHWVQDVEKTCDALDKVQDYNEFQPLMENFQVCFFAFVKSERQSKCLLLQLD